jgi:hypothetical protein
MFDSHSSKKPARKQAGRALSAADGRFFTVFSRHRRYLGAEKRPRLTAANYPSFPIAAPMCAERLKAKEKVIHEMLTRPTVG